MQIPDSFVPVLLAQIGLFLVLWAILKRFWFEPALRIIATRTERSQGALADVETVQNEVTRLRREHAEALERVKTETQREIQDLLRQAEAEQRRLVDEATADAQKTIESTRGVVAAEVASARQNLKNEMQTIAREVARVVVGRAV